MISLPCAESDVGPGVVWGMVRARRSGRVRRFHCPGWCWGVVEMVGAGLVQAAEVPQTWIWAGTVRVVMSVGACPNG